MFWWGQGGGVAFSIGLPGTSDFPVAMTNLLTSVTSRKKDLFGLMVSESLVHTLLALCTWLIVVEEMHAEERGYSHHSRQEAERQPAPEDCIAEFNALPLGIYSLR